MKKALRSFFIGIPFMVFSITCAVISATLGVVGIAALSIFGIAAAGFAAISFVLLCWAIGKDNAKELFGKAKDKAKEETP